MTPTPSSKFGACPLCPKNSPHKRLYGGVCAFHIQHKDQDESQQRWDQPVKTHDDKLLHKYFLEQSVLRPKYCENRCGNKLIGQETWRLKAFVCHIVPKKTFKSVMLHPLNRWFGCLDCHHDYDDKGWTHAVTMPVWPVCVERFKEFMTLISDTEVRKLPVPLLEILNATL
jgi:hypothetical protein